MSGITTHILDTARGRPAAGVAVVLEQRGSGREEWRPMGHAETDIDGRVRRFTPAGAALEPGVYRLIFDTRSYFDKQSISTFYPAVVVVFETATGESDYHVPLLLGPYGYTTYRGS